MRMARVNVYLPDDLADAARAAGLNVSGITQAALTSALAERDTNRWLDSIARMKPTEITHAQALDALHAARDEMGTPADA
jgi:post-segregation antitoxin (ccd killing protein)